MSPSPSLNPEDSKIWVHVRGLKKKEVRMLESTLQIRIPDIKLIFFFFKCKFLMVFDFFSNFNIYYDPAEYLIHPRYTLHKYILFFILPNFLEYILFTIFFITSWIKQDMNVTNHKFQKLSKTAMNFEFVSFSFMPLFKRFYATTNL